MHSFHSATEAVLLSMIVLLAIEISRPGSKQPGIRDFRRKVHGNGQTAPLPAKDKPEKLRFSCAILA
jgi:hypothetical protein